MCCPLRAYGNQRSKSYHHKYFKELLAEDCLYVIEPFVVIGRADNIDDLENDV